MSSNLRIAYLAHSLRSDWNNGNAHFLRGLMRALTSLGHQVTVFENAEAWSTQNLHQEVLGKQSLDQFAATYPDLSIATYADPTSEDYWRAALSGTDIVVLHEWNDPSLARLLLTLRPVLQFKLLFHDTHHRASSTPGEIERFGLPSFDGVLAFGGSLRDIYVGQFGLKRVWVLHEAADETVFAPDFTITRKNSIVWVGNWGEEERSKEIHRFLLEPAAALKDEIQTTIYGVRYPADGLAALTNAHVKYGGYLPNLAAPRVYADAGATVHVPRQQYSAAMTGIPTIRVFEALACGIPLVSAPWEDSEQLFRTGDFVWANDSTSMTEKLRFLLETPDAAAEQAARGRETVLARHTCMHRAKELVAICEDVL